MRRNKDILDRQNSCRDRGREGRIERTVFRDSGKPMETHLRESRKLNNRRKREKTEDNSSLLLVILFVILEVMKYQL